MQIDHRPPDTVGAKALADARKTFGVGFGYAGLLSMFIGLLSLTVPLFTMQLYDRVMASQSLDTLTMLAMLAMIGLLLYGTLDFIRALTFQSIASMMLRGLNPVALRAAVASSATSGAAHASQALRDLHEIRSFLTGGAIATPLDAAWTPLYFVVLFALHPMYGLIGILSVALMVATGLASDVLTRRSLQRASSSSLETVAEVAGSLRHAEAIESMGMLPALARRWTHKQDMSLDLFDAATLRGRAMASFTRIARQAMQIATLSAGIVLVIQHDVSPGTLLAASIIMGRLLGPFEGVVDNLRQWIGAQMAWRRICTLVEHEAPQRDTKATPANRGDLVVDRLVYAPPGAEIPVLKGVSFRLSPGEVLGVIGASAAGKSTLARTLVGVLKPTAGGVYLDGQGTFLWERESFGKAVGYLPQSVSLLDGSVRDNIARMAETEPASVIEAARRAGIHDMIGRLPFGYETRIGENSPLVSGGQRQRIALARALFGNPGLLVLDEPNASLDTQGEQALLSAIGQARDEGAIVVIIAHRPSVMQVADKMLVLEEGRVAHFGERTQVMAALEGGARERRGAPGLSVVASRAG